MIQNIDNGKLTAVIMDIHIAKKRPCAVCYNDVNEMYGQFFMLSRRMK